MTILKIVLSDSGQAFRHTHSVHDLAKDCNKVLETALFDDEIIDLYKELSQYNSIARNPASCDAPVDVITKKQALSAMDTVTKTVLILEEVYGRN